MSYGKFRALLMLTFLVMSLMFSFLMRGSDGPMLTLLITFGFGFLMTATAWLVFGKPPGQS